MLRTSLRSGSGNLRQGELNSRTKEDRLINVERKLCALILLLARSLGSFQDYSIQ